MEIASSFPDETVHVIIEISRVYKNDRTAKELNLAPQERLLFHQRESGPVMRNLRGWLSEQLDQKKVEPNSGLGKAIAYMLKHWEPLTLFLRVPGAPLDNYICERILKKAILNRKNSLFYCLQKPSELDALELPGRHLHQRFLTNLPGST